MDQIESILPAFRTPWEIRFQQFPRGEPVDHMLQAPVRREVPDQHDPASRPPGRQIGEESRHPLDRLAMAFTVRIRVIAEVQEIMLDLRHARAVTHSEVTLTQPPIMQDRHVRATERDLHRFHRAAQIRSEHRSDAVVAAPPTRLGAPWVTWAQPMRVISDDETGLLLWHPVGSDIARLIDADGNTPHDIAVDRMRDPKLTPQSWTDYDILVLMRPDTAHAVWWCFQQGAFAGW